MYKLHEHTWQAYKVCPKGAINLVQNEDTPYPVWNEDAPHPVWNEDTCNVLEQNKDSIMESQFWCSSRERERSVTSVSCCWGDRIRQYNRKPILVYMLESNCRELKQRLVHLCLYLILICNTLLRNGPDLPAWTGLHIDARQNWLLGPVDQVKSIIYIPLPSVIGLSLHVGGTYTDSLPYLP